MSHKWLVTAAAVIPMIWTLPAFAQQAGTPAAAPSEDQGLQDIVVTAQRRAEAVQSTPLAITALGGSDLEDRRITTVEGLNTLVPNMNFARYAGVAQVAIRGVAFDVINPGAEGRAAIYNDGVYVSRPSAALANFFDVERVEVLRGPQGTLYGRNATAGAVNIISRDPTPEVEGYGRLTIGNYGHVQVDAAVGGPLSETVSARLAVQTIDHSGFGKNVSFRQDVDNEHTRAVRAKILFQPSDDFNFKLTGEYNNRDDASAGRHNIGDGRGRPDVTPRGIALGGTFAANPRDIAGYPIGYRRDIYGLSGEANWDVGSAVTLTSVTGYRNTHVRIASNTDSTTKLLSPQQIDEKAWQVSQEIRANIDLERVKLIVGGYYFHEKIDGFTFTQLDGAATRPGPPGFQLGTPGVLIYGADFGGRLKTDAYAAFGQADIDITDQLTLVLGARYSHERKIIDEYNVVDLTTIYTGVRRTDYPRSLKSASFNSFDPKITLNFKPSDGILIYATFSQGFKSGGFALGGMLPAFKPEKLKDYEVGVKADLLDRRLRVNLAGFYYDYKNLQVTKVNGTLVTTENAANATIKGIEAEIRAVPVEGFNLGVNVSYLDARFDEFFTAEPARPALGVQSLAGNRISQSPRYIVSGDFAYEWNVGEGNMFVRGDVTWKDRIYFSPFNRPEVSQAPYAIANASIGYKSDKGWEVSAYVRNLTDKLYRTSTTVGNVFGGFSLGGQYGDPRTYGVTFGYNF